MPTRLRPQNCSERRALVQHEVFCLKLWDQLPTSTAGSQEESQHWDNRSNDWSWTWNNWRPQDQRWWGPKNVDNYW